MQSQYGTNSRKAVLQFTVGTSPAAGAPTLKSGLNCSLSGSPTGTVSINGVSSTIASTTDDTGARP